jgi:transposase-like protein
MESHTLAPNYTDYRFPPEIISHAVWLYFRFSLSFRDVEELLSQRGIVVTYETVHQWCLKFGQKSAGLSWHEYVKRGSCTKSATIADTRGGLSPFHETGVLGTR